jgi:hypothetical protein
MQSFFQFHPFWSSVCGVDSTGFQVSKITIVIPLLECLKSINAAIIGPQKNNLILLYQNFGLSGLDYDVASQTYILEGTPQACWDAIYALESLFWYISRVNEINTDIYNQDYMHAYNNLEAKKMAWHPCKKLENC